MASATPNTPEHDTLADHVHCAEVDLNYTLYHPLLEKYVGIFPRQDAPKTRQDKPAIWTVVEACMANGTLQALRDGKLQTTATAMPLRPQPAAPGTWHRKSGKQNQKASVTGTSANLAANEQDEGSDGGFFEE